MDADKSDWGGDWEGHHNNEPDGAFKTTRSQGFTGHDDVEKLKDGRAERTRASLFDAVQRENLGEIGGRTHKRQETNPRDNNGDSTKKVITIGGVQIDLGAVKGNQRASWAEARCNARRATEHAILRRNAQLAAIRQELCKETVTKVREKRTVKVDGINQRDKGPIDKEKEIHVRERDTIFNGGKDNTPLINHNAALIKPPEGQDKDGWIEVRCKKRHMPKVHTQSRYQPWRQNLMAQGKFLTAWRKGIEDFNAQMKSNVLNATYRVTPRIDAEPPISLRGELRRLQQHSQPLSL